MRSPSSGLSWLRMSFVLVLSQTAVANEVKVGRRLVGWDDGIAGVVDAMVQSVVESQWVETVQVSEDVLGQKILAVMRKLLGPEVSEAKISPELQEMFKHLQRSELEVLEQIRQEMEQNPILEPSHNPDEGNDDGHG